MFRAAAWSNVWSRRSWVWMLGGLVVLSVSWVARQSWGPSPAAAVTPPAVATSAANPTAANSAPAAAANAAPAKLETMAMVNGEAITRNDLARESLRHYGAEVLDSVINKRLIAERCQQLNLAVTNEEVAAEIDRMAQRFGVGTDQWLKMLKEERQITPAQYAKDIIWPTLALRKLAAERCEPTEQEVQQAYETQYGSAVKARLIVCNSAEKARHVYALAVQQPDQFPELAKQYSDDPNTASAKGMVPPMRRHLGDPNLERIAFGLQPGSVSEPVAIGGQYVILKCESHLPAVRVPMDQVRQTLTEACRDRKLRLQAPNVFGELQQQAQVVTILGDAQKMQQNPGVAAIVNGRPLSLLELAEECIERHGREVLEGTINRKLLEQACRRKTVTVTEAELNDEMTRAAVSMGKTKPDGSADLDAWIQHVTEEQKISLDRYRHDIVWPSVALKKLVGTKVTVTSDDIAKGFEANYGPRVRLRAVVCNQHRKALEVWEMARNKPTAEYFGDLAEQYSVEASSRALRGEVPPIHRHSNQPLLEEEAFKLQPGELSGVIQVEDKFVILFCEGYTQPVNVSLASVEGLIREDVHEKKLRAVMAREFEKLQDNARVDNYLTGTSRAPKSAESADALSAGGQPGAPRVGTATR